MSVPSAQRAVCNGYLIDTNNASMGGLVTVIATTPVTLPLDPSLGTFEEYYFIYYIKTDVAVTLTMPNTANVSRGMGIRVILNSVTGLGTITINDQSGLLTSMVASTTQSMVCVDIYNTINNLNWSLSRYLFDVPQIRRFVVNPSKALITKELTITNFCAYSAAPGSTLNVNSTTPVAVPWSTTQPGYFVDNVYLTHSAVNPTRITALTAVTLLVKILTFVNNAGGATAINRIGIRVNGGTIGFGENTLGTISPSATTSVETLYNTSIVSGNFIEILVYKTAVSGGTNLLNQGNTCINIQVII